MLGPHRHGAELRTKTLVLLLEPDGSASLGAQLTPQSEWLVEVGSEALSVGALALSVGRPLAGSADRTPAGVGWRSLRGYLVIDHDRE